MTAGERPLPRFALDKDEAAASLGMSTSHFKRHVQKHLRVVRSGQLCLYPVGELERWAEENATLGGRRA